MSIIGLIENNDDNKNMVRLAQEKLPGYKPEWGYGYYLFTEAEYIPLDKAIILMDIVSTHLCQVLLL